MFSWRRCYGQVIAVLQNRSQTLRVKSPNMVCSKFKNETKTFLPERHLLIQNISLETKTSILMKFWKLPLRVRNDPHWSQKTVKNLNNFSKQNFLRFVPLAEKVHFWQGCRTVFAIKLKNFRSNPETVDELKKSLTPVVFHRKDPLARRVQFCKPCLRKFNRNWCRINQNTKRTKKFAQFSQKN